MDHEFDVNEFTALNFDTEFQTFLSLPTGSGIEGFNYQTAHDKNNFGKSGVENSQCSGCKKLQADLNLQDAEHRANFLFLKRKVISTDKLIQRCKAKQEEFERQDAEIQDLKRKLEQAARDSDILLQQLNTAIESVQPLREEKERLESELKSKSLEVNNLADKLEGERSYRGQQLAQDDHYRNLEHEVNKMKRLNTNLTTKNRSLEARAQELLCEKKGLTSSKNIAERRQESLALALKKAQDICDEIWAKLVPNERKKKPNLIPNGFKALIRRIVNKKMEGSLSANGTSKLTEEENADDSANDDEECGDDDNDESDMDNFEDLDTNADLDHEDIITRSQSADNEFDPSAAFNEKSLGSPGSVYQNTSSTVQKSQVENGLQNLHKSPRKCTEGGLSEASVPSGNKGKVSPVKTQGTVWKISPGKEGSGGLKTYEQENSTKAGKVLGSVQQSPKKVDLVSGKNKVPSSEVKGRKEQGGKDSSKLVKGDEDSSDSSSLSSLSSLSDDSDSDDDDDERTCPSTVKNANKDKDNKANDKKLDLDKIFSFFAIPDPVSPLAMSPSSACSVDIQDNKTSEIGEKVVFDARDDSVECGMEFEDQTGSECDNNHSKDLNVTSTLHQERSAWPQTVLSGHSTGGTTLSSDSDEEDDDDKRPGTPNVTNSNGNSAPHRPDPPSLSCQELSRSIVSSNSLPTKVNLQQAGPSTLAATQAASPELSNAHVVSSEHTVDFVECADRGVGNIDNVSGTGKSISINICSIKALADDSISNRSFSIKNSSEIISPGNVPLESSLKTTTDTSTNAQINNLNPSPHDMTSSRTSLRTECSGCDGDILNMALGNQQISPSKQEENVGNEPSAVKESRVLQDSLETVCQIFEASTAKINSYTFSIPKKPNGNQAGTLLQTNLPENFNLTLSSPKVPVLRLSESPQGHISSSADFNISLSNSEQISASAISSNQISAPAKSCDLMSSSAISSDLISSSATSSHLLPAPTTNYDLISEPAISTDIISVVITSNDKKTAGTPFNIQNSTEILLHVCMSSDTAIALENSISTLTPVQSNCDNLQHVQATPSKPAVKDKGGDQCLEDILGDVNDLSSSSGDEDDGVNNNREKNMEAGNSRDAENRSLSSENNEDEGVNIIKKTFQVSDRPLRRNIICSSDDDDDTGDRVMSIKNRRSVKRRTLRSPTDRLAEKLAENHVELPENESRHSFIQGRELTVFKNGGFVPLKGGSAETEFNPEIMNQAGGDDSGETQSRLSTGSKLEKERSNMRGNRIVLEEACCEGSKASLERKTSPEKNPSRSPVSRKKTLTVTRKVSPNTSPVSKNSSKTVGQILSSKKASVTMKNSTRQDLSLSDLSDTESSESDARTRQIRQSGNGLKEITKNIKLDSNNRARHVKQKPSVIKKNSQDLSLSDLSDTESSEDDSSLEVPPKSNQTRASWARKGGNGYIKAIRNKNIESNSRARQLKQRGVHDSGTIVAQRKSYVGSRDKGEDSVGKEDKQDLEIPSKGTLTFDSSCGSSGKSDGSLSTRSLRQRTGTESLGDTRSDKFEKSADVRHTRQSSHLTENSDMTDEEKITTNDIVAVKENIATNAKVTTNDKVITQDKVVINVKVEPKSHMPHKMQTKKSGSLTSTTDKFLNSADMRRTRRSSRLSESSDLMDEENISVNEESEQKCLSQVKKQTNGHCPWVFSDSGSDKLVNTTDVRKTRRSSHLNDLNISPETIDLKNTPANSLPQERQTRRSNRQSLSNSSYDKLVNVADRSCSMSEGKDLADDNAVEKSQTPQKIQTREPSHISLDSGIFANAAAVRQTRRSSHLNAGSEVADEEMTTSIAKANIKSGTPQKTQAIDRSQETVNSEKIVNAADMRQTRKSSRLSVGSDVAEEEMTAVNTIANTKSATPSKTQTMDPNQQTLDSDKCVNIAHVRQTRRLSHLSVGSHVADEEKTASKDKANRIAHTPKKNQTRGSGPQSMNPDKLEIMADVRHTRRSSQLSESSVLPEKDDINKTSYDKIKLKSCSPEKPSEMESSFHHVARKIRQTGKMNLNNSENEGELLKSSCSVPLGQLETCTVQRQTRRSSRLSESMIAVSEGCDVGHFVETAKTCLTKTLEGVVNSRDKKPGTSFHDLRKVDTFNAEDIVQTIDLKTSNHSNISLQSTDFKTSVNSDILTKSTDSKSCISSDISATASDNSKTSFQTSMHSSAQTSMQTSLEAKDDMMNLAQLPVIYNKKDSVHFCKEKVDAVLHFSPECDNVKNSVIHGKPVCNNMIGYFHSKGMSEEIEVASHKSVNGINILNKSGDVINSVNKSMSVSFDSNFPGTTQNQFLKNQIISPVKDKSRHAWKVKRAETNTVHDCSMQPECLSRVTKNDKPASLNLSLPASPCLTLPLLSDIFEFFSIPPPLSPLFPTPPPSVENDEKTLVKFSSKAPMSALRVPSQKRVEGCATSQRLGSYSSQILEAKKLLGKRRSETQAKQKLVACTNGQKPGAKEVRSIWQNRTSEDIHNQQNCQKKSSENIQIKLNGLNRTANDIRAVSNVQKRTVDNIETRSNGEKRTADKIETRSNGQKRTADNIDTVPIKKRKLGDISEHPITLTAIMDDLMLFLAASEVNVRTTLETMLTRLEEESTQALWDILCQVIIQYLESATQEDVTCHLLAACEKEGTVNTVFVSEGEKRLVSLISSLLRMDKELDIRKLLGKMWAAIFSRGCSSELVRLSYCRMFSSICLELGDLEQVRILVYNIAWCDHLDLVRPLLAILGVWPDVISMGYSVSQSSVIQVLKFLLREKCKGDNSLFDTVCLIMQRICQVDLTKLDDPTEKMVKSLLDELQHRVQNVIHGAKVDNTFETMKAVELLLVYQGPDWVEKNFIKRALVSTAMRWDNKSEDKTGPPDLFVVRLIGIFRSLISVQQLSNTAINIVLGTVFPRFLRSNKTCDIRLELTCVEAVMEVAPLSPEKSLELLKTWQTKKKGNIPPEIFSKLQQVRNLVSREIPPTEKKKKKQNYRQKKKVRKE